jgi:hypothetical protein
MGDSNPVYAIKYRSFAGNWRFEDYYRMVEG